MSLLLASLLLVQDAQRQPCDHGSCLPPVSTQGVRSARLIIHCPASAQILINGYEIPPSGAIRYFETAPMTEGTRRDYEITLRPVEGGAITQTVSIGPGERKEVILSSTEAPRNYGIDVMQLAPKSSHSPQQLVIASTIERNGRAISVEQAQNLLDRAALPDPNRKRVTIIGSEAERKAALRAIEQLPLAITDQCVVQDYASDHWAVARVGFSTTGHPTIYAQEPDGRVIFRQDNLENLETNFQQLRKTNSNYDSSADPDYRMKESGMPPWLPIAIFGLILLVLFPPRTTSRS